MPLVSMPRAKGHLRIPIDDTDSDPDVYLKLVQACDIVTDYLKSRADPTWDEDTTPRRVQSAVLLVLGHLYEHRGDDMTTDTELWTALARMLMRSRDPALA